MSTTTHVAEVAVPDQHAIMLRSSDGALELSQEYSGAYRAIHVQPGNVLRLIRAMLVSIGLEDVYLYRQAAGGGACSDVEWPDEAALDDEAGIELSSNVPLTAHGVEAPKPKDATAAERQRRHRANKARLDRDSVTDDRDSVTDEPQLRLVAAG